ncbi:MAG: hypothetical protein AAFN41_09480 [Planctomycetota bacterium]
MPVPIATIRQTRRVVIVFVAIATTLFAITLIVHALSPKGLGLAPTSQLLAILALLTLPACTIAAWAWDRAVRRRTAAAALQAEADRQRLESDPMYNAYDPAREIVIDADERLSQPQSEPAPEPIAQPDPARAREHPAGRTRPHDAPAHPTDFELPDAFDRELGTARS